jgi:nucleoside-diphosphate kinase
MEAFMAFEKTLVLIKPDAVKRKLIGTLLKMYEEKGLEIEQIKSVFATEEQLARHYQAHIGKDFYPRLMTFMKSGMMIAIVLSGEQAIEIVRGVNGATDYLKADMGSIRGRFANGYTENCVHGSDSLESAEIEIDIWFN